MSASCWLTPADLIAKLRRRWESGQLLTAYTQKQWTPITVPLRAPTAAELAEHFGAAQDWLDAWKHVDQKLVRLRWRRVGGRVVGNNEIPHQAVIEEPEQAWELLRVRRQVRAYTRMLEATARDAPALVEWMTSEPMKVLAHEPHWTRLIEATRWIDGHATAELYVRQIDVPGVDTKFIEEHRGVLAQMLDRQLTPDRVDQTYPPAQFARRYRFRAKPTYVRLRALAQPISLAHPASAAHPAPAPLGPFGELSVRVDELATTPIAAARVMIVENEITYLALPPTPDTIAIFGGGYAVRALAALPWLRERELVYWGDIDTHGFAILDRLRRAFPHVISMLMDEDTLLRHREHWGHEATPTNTPLTHLTREEAALYRDLTTDRYAAGVRLEQERIRFGVVRQRLAQWQTAE